MESNWILWRQDMRNGGNKTSSNLVRIHFGGLMFSLTRERDGVGDSGPMSRIIWEEDGELKYEDGGRPRVGVQIIVGSYIARTMQHQDYWHTTTITEILEERDDYARFKTGNSIYVWKNS